MPVHHHIYHIVHQHHLGERLGLGEEVLLQVVAEMLEHPLQYIVGTDERRDVVAPCQAHRNLVYIFRAVELALKPVRLSGTRHEIVGIRSRHILVASCVLEPPVLGIRQLLLVVPSIQDLVVVAGILARVVGEQHREDIVVLVLSADERPAETDALIEGAAPRYHLVLEDALQLHVLYLRVEGSVVDVEGGGDVALVLCREHNLPALGKIFPILDAHVGSHHLLPQTEGVGISQYHAVVVACRNIQRGRRLPVVVEERIGPFHLQLGTFAKLVGFSLIQIRYFHRSSFIFWQISSPGFSVPAWHQAP